MKEYQISYVEIVRYEDTFVEAKDEDEAREKFLDLLGKGEISIRETDEQTFEIEEC